MTALHFSTLPTATSSSCCHSGLYPHTVSRDDPFPELVIVRDFVASAKKAAFAYYNKIPEIGTYEEKGLFGFVVLDVLV